MPVYSFIKIGANFYMKTLQRRVALAPAQLVCLGMQLLLDRTADSLLVKLPPGGGCAFTA